MPKPINNYAEAAEMAQLLANITRNPYYVVEIYDEQDIGDLYVLAEIPTDLTPGRMDPYVHETLQPSLITEGLLV